MDNWEETQVGWCLSCWGAESFDFDFLSPVEIDEPPEPEEDPQWIRMDSPEEEQGLDDFVIFVF